MVGRGIQMKLLASDYDNTLSFNNVIKETDKIAIRDFQNQRNLFGVCTSHSLRGIVEFTEDIWENKLFFFHNIIK